MPILPFLRPRNLSARKRVCSESILSMIQPIWRIQRRARGNGGTMIPVTSELSREESQSVPDNKSFLDNIVYNLRVETSGLTQVRFIFNPLTNEELFADLKGRLVFTKDPSASRLTGE